MKYFLSDTWVMSWRVMKQITRSLDTVITVLIMPVLMLLAFRYVFGGAMDLGRISAADYMLPGVILMTVMSGVAYTGYRVFTDIQKGIFERFHSMPIQKSSVLGGHVVVSVMSNLISALIIVLIGFLVGFRPQANLFEWVQAFLIVLIFTVGLTWISVFSALIAKSTDTAGIFAYFLMGLGFVSSSYAPIEFMPKALAAFARHQPVTAVADSLRNLLLGKAKWQTVVVALIWCTGICAAFWALSVWAYKRKLK